MFVLCGIAASLLLWLLSPAEWSPWLERLATPALALAVFGYALDLRLRRSRPESTPQLPWLLALLAWAFGVLALESPARVGSQLALLATPLVLYLLIAHGVQSFRALQAVAGVILLATLLVSLVAVAEGLAPRGCFRDEAGLNENETRSSQSETRSTWSGNRPFGGRLVWDGRRCASRLDCERESGAEAGVDYQCEHIGPFGTQSIGTRARYQGALADPDFTALVIALGLPLGFALGRRRVVGAALLTLAVLAEIYTRSRVGQLALVAVTGVYALRRFGARGVVPAAALALLFLRWGAPEEHVSSTAGWYDALLVLRQAPLDGVGLGQLGEHELVAARSSFLVAAAELGLPGLWLLSLLVYLSLKIPLATLRRVSGNADAVAAERMALALLASASALAVGLLFLPMLHLPLPWIFLGLASALHASMRTHDTGFTVGLGWRDLAAVAAADGVLLLGMWQAASRS
jgi:hypothetical protein